MSRTDAERSLRIYKTFVERTNEVIEYLSEAKALEHAMLLQVPNVKHVLNPLKRTDIGSHWLDAGIRGVP
jgi:hypothetical protein